MKPIEIGDIVRVQYEGRQFNVRIINILNNGYRTIPIDNNHGLTHNQFLTCGMHSVGKYDIVKPNLLPEDLFTL